MAIKLIVSVADPTAPAGIAYFFTAPEGVTPAAMHQILRDNRFQPCVRPDNQAVVVVTPLNVPEAKLMSDPGDQIPYVSGLGPEYTLPGADLEQTRDAVKKAGFEPDV